MSTGFYPDSAGPYDAEGIVVRNIVFVVALLARGGMRGGEEEEAVDQRERAAQGTREVDR